MKYLLILFTVFSFAQFNPIFFGSSNGIGNKNLVAYYKVNSTTTEATGLSPNGSPTGVTYTTGIIGNAAVFGAGSFDRMDIADSDNFSFTDGTNDIPFSINLWVYFTAFNTDSNYFISKGNGVAGNHEWQFLRYNDGRLYFTKFDKVSLSIYQQIGTSSTSPFSIGQWYMLTFTDDGSKSIAGMKLYINGVAQGMVNASAGTYTGLPNGTAFTRMGNAPSASGAANSVHKGNIDEVSVWKNRVLTDTNIKYLYSNGVGKTYPF